MNRPRSTRSSAHIVVLCFSAFVALLLLNVVQAATPFTSATVTRLQNKVSYGESVSGATRVASVADVIRSNNFLLTESDSRAELQYNDGSLVRIGQNTIFSFEASSRTLALQKGTFIFYVPKGAGGGTIKTPSLTAAITGTAGKVSTNIIAIIEGTVKLVPSGLLVHSGEFARRNPDGTITIGKFDPAKVLDGFLVTFNGVMPGFEENQLQIGSKLPPLDFRSFETIHRTQNLPSAIDQFFPPPPNNPPPADRKNPKVFVPPPTNPPPNRNGGGGGNNNY